MGLRLSRNRQLQNIIDKPKRGRTSSNADSNKEILEALDIMKRETHAIKEIIKPTTVHVQIS